MLVFLLLLYTVLFDSHICEHFKGMEQEESIPIANVTLEQEYKRVIDLKPPILSSCHLQCSTAVPKINTYMVYLAMHKGDQLQCSILDTTTLGI